MTSTAEGGDVQQYQGWQVADRQQIVELLARYGDILDLKRFDALNDVFTDDCIFDVYASGDRIVRGVADLVETLRSALKPVERSVHLFSNEQVTFRGHDAARACANVHAWHRSRSGHEWDVWGRYDDQLVRVDGLWRVSHRRERFFRTRGVDDQRFLIIDPLAFAEDPFRDVGRS